MLDPDGESVSKGTDDTSLQVPLVFVSLLRKGTLEKDRSETKLASAFDAVSTLIAGAPLLHLPFSVSGYRCYAVYRVVCMCRWRGISARSTSCRSPT